jgi:hypothetical protein
MLSMLISQIAGNVAEGSDSLALRFRKRSDCVTKAMVEMVTDQRLLGCADGFFNGMKLLSDIRTRAARLDHIDDAAQMSVGPLQPFDDRGVALVAVFAGCGCLIH